MIDPTRFSHIFFNHFLHFITPFARTCHQVVPWLEGPGCGLTALCRRLTGAGLEMMWMDDFPMEECAWICLELQIFAHWRCCKAWGLEWSRLSCSCYYFGWYACVHALFVPVVDAYRTQVTIPRKSGGWNCRPEPSRLKSYPFLLLVFSPFFCPTCFCRSTLAWLFLYPGISFPQKWKGQASKLVP